MRRFPDFSGLVARVFLTASLACLGAGVMWLARACGDAILPASAPGQTNVDRPRVIANTSEPGPGQAQVQAEQLVAAGQELWDKYVPAEIRAAYEFPSIDEVRRFLTRLETEIDEGSSTELVAYERDARRALRALRRYEGGDLLAAWLEPRLDLLKAATQIASTPVARWPEVIPGMPAAELRREEVGPTPMMPLPSMDRPQFSRAYWDQVLARRRAPRGAEDLVPRLKEIFADSGVPPELVWIAEVESSMNPEATSPVGARGLFQFMPLTAARFGLADGLMVDERTDPEKSARAAAAYLRILHRRFGSWPLALAAYNAGEGRVGRMLARENATTFDAVAHRLPLETRMYVPKVLATVAARESVDPDLLPGPWPVGAAPRREAAADPAAIATVVDTEVPPAAATSPTSL